MQLAKKILVSELIYFNDYFAESALWKSKVAVLAGDCLSLNALLLTLSNKDYATFEIYTSAIEKIVDGEILQLKKTIKLNIGKPKCNDIRDKKLTLPLIYTLDTCSPKLKRKLIHIIKHKSKNFNNIAFVINEVTKAGGIQYAQNKMFEYRDEALNILNEFPESDSSSALDELVRLRLHNSRVSTPHIMAYVRLH